MILIIHTGVLCYFYKHGTPGRIVGVCHTLSWCLRGDCSKRAVKLKSLQQSRVCFFSFSHFVPRLVLALAVCPPDTQPGAWFTSRTSAAAPAQGSVWCIHLPGSYFQSTPEMSQGCYSFTLPSPLGFMPRKS